MSRISLGMIRFKDPKSYPGKTGYINQYISKDLVIVCINGDVIAIKTEYIEILEPLIIKKT